MNTYEKLQQQVEEWNKYMDDFLERYGIKLEDFANNEKMQKQLRKEFEESQPTK